MYQIKNLLLFSTFDLYGKNVIIVTKSIWDNKKYYKKNLNKSKCSNKQKNTLHCLMMNVLYTVYQINYRLVISLFRLYRL